MALENLLPKAVCGHLVQGLVHNMSGPLQILSMQLELLRMSQAKLARLATPEQQEIIAQQEQKLAQMEAQVERLKDILEAISQATHEAPTPIDLNSLLEKLLVLWEGDLKFKHQVYKELETSPEPVSVVAPPAALWQGFCALFWALVPKAVEGGYPFKVRTFQEEGQPGVEISLEGADALPVEDEFWGLAEKIFAPYAHMEVSGGRVKLTFRNS
ncbi:MAG: HAMP domain-containing histidine kinase [Thermodesulfobacteria bacterium]|nr:HAMP domain-containing histidine kinase [Thermodesulfobacteriota bacterium]